jgi:hypothetical protein
MRYTWRLSLALVLAAALALPLSASAAGLRPVPWGRVWTPADLDPENPLQVQWVKESADRWTLDTFFFGAVRDFFTSKIAGPGHAPRLRLLNRGKLTFNPKSGLIFLGDREVGVWRGSSRFRGQTIRNGFQLTAPVRIDPLRNTIQILED